MEEQERPFKEGEPPFLSLPDLSKEVVVELKNHLAWGELWETAEVGLAAGEDLAAFYSLSLSLVNQEFYIALNYALDIIFPQGSSPDAEALGRFGVLLVFEGYNEYFEKTMGIRPTGNLKTMQIPYQENPSDFWKWFSTGAPDAVEDISLTHPNLAQFITDVADKIHAPYSLLPEPFAREMKQSSYPFYFQRGALAAVGFLNNNWDTLTKSPSRL